MDPAVAACRGALRSALADLPFGAAVAAACSGGADSLALASALLREAPRAGLRPVVLTVDHGLQPGSDERADGVVTWAQAAGAQRAEVLRVRVGSAGGPEAAARQARYAVLDAAAERLELSAVFLGHTLDDQAETVLLGLARGSGARSLAGMAPVAGRYRRPFLHLPRAVTSAACTALGLQPWDDPHNADPSYTRVRIRREALPALEASAGPGVAAALARTARLLRDDADALDRWAQQAAREAARGGSGGSEPAGGGALRVSVLADLPAAVRRRVLRTAAVEVGVPPGALSAGHLQAVDELITAWHGQGPVSLPGAYGAIRRCGWLHLVAPDAGGPPPQEQ
ncbi:MAG: tRNA lysidine(34) synthetase TilS [Actinomycetota bacterium]|nr:tRNA lysidine(34) synthetase TilS [Actinomycetota bacterium]